MAGVESERSARATSCRSLKVKVGCLIIIQVSYDLDAHQSRPIGN